MFYQIPDSSGMAWAQRFTSSGATTGDTRGYGTHKGNAIWAVAVDELCIAGDGLPGTLVLVIFTVPQCFKQQ